MWWFGAAVGGLYKSTEVGRDGGVDFLSGSGVVVDWKERAGGGSRGGLGSGSGAGLGGGLA